jgi:hypothetical protein
MSMSQTHRALVSDGQASLRPSDRPHLFEIVELAGFGTKDVNHDIPGIDQNPIAMGQAFDVAGAIACILQARRQMLRDCADLALRAARADHHIVGDRGFAAKIDGDDILSLVLVERMQNKRQQIGRLSRPERFGAQVGILLK